MGNSESAKTQPVGGCGLYCYACPVESCKGCISETIEEWCCDCLLKHCVLKRGLETCAFCEEYPCDMLTDFNNDKYPHHSTVIPNLDVIRKQGIENWMREQDQRWRCTECGTRFTWYDETCKSCGTKVFNCVDEENARKSRDKEKM